MADISEIRARIKRPTATVTLCLDADLAGKYQELDAKLRAAAPGASLAGNPEADAILADMEAIRQRMVASEVVFHFMALPAPDFAHLRVRMPTKKDGQSDDDFADAYHGWVCEVVAASCVDPAMTVEDAAGLASDLAGSQWKELSDAAWNVNADLTSIPFSATESVLRRISAEKLRQPGPSANPEAGSLAGNPSSGSSATGTAGSSSRSRSGRKRTATS